MSATPTADAAQDELEVGRRDERGPRRHEHHGEPLRVEIAEAGLADTLRQPGPYTVFAPSDDAFKAVPAKTITFMPIACTGVKPMLTMLTPVTRKVSVNRAGAPIAMASSTTGGMSTLLRKQSTSSMRSWRAA